MSEFQEAALSEVPVSAIGRPVLWTRPVYTGTAEALAAKEAALFERLAEIAAKHGVGIRLHRPKETEAFAVRFVEERKAAIERGEVAQPVRRARWPIIALCGSQRTPA